MCINKYVNNLTFFPPAQGTNLLGGDLPASEGGEGVETAQPNNCAVECYRRAGCKYWVWVEGWKKNCFLKSHFDDQARTRHLCLHYCFSQ